MNFLLYMIGRPYHQANPEFTRPAPRQHLLRAAAIAAAQGRFSDAVKNTARLASLPDTATPDTFILAHLQLHTRDYAAARESFEQGIARAFGDSPAAALLSENSPMSIDGHYLDAFDAGHLRGSSLERLINTADQDLRQGRYVRAIEHFQRARNAVDTLLAANAGLILANAREQNTFLPPPEAATPLLPLAKLGDLLLRMLARTHLAANVARGLRQRELRDDLAPWATTNQNVDQLLEGEFLPLQKSTATLAGHAESNYRLGIVARARGHMEDAAAAFTRVLNVHPHHVLSATLLTATLLQLGRGETVMPLLAAAFAVPVQTLDRYHSLASAAGDHAHFDRTVTHLCRGIESESQRSVVKANLAFALSEMGLLDEERAAWREPTHASSAH